MSHQTLTFISMYPNILIKYFPDEFAAKELVKFMTARDYFRMKDNIDANDTPHLYELLRCNKICINNIIQGMSETALYARVVLKAQQVMERTLEILYYRGVSVIRSDIDIIVLEIISDGELDIINRLIKPLGAKLERD